MAIAPGLAYLPIVGLGENRHLHVVLTYPDADGDVLVVSVTTRRERSDATTVLNTGDHDFIAHASVVDYRRTRAEQAGTLEKRLLSGVYRLYSPFKPEVLQRIQAGVLGSPFTKQGIKQRFYENPHLQ